MSIAEQLRTIKHLEDAKAKIIKPENWTTGALYRNEKDEEVGKPTEACKFCSLGAYDATGENLPKDGGWQYMRIMAQGLDYRSAIQFNDNNSHEVVIAGWDKAISRAKLDLIVMNLESLLEAVKEQPEELFNLNSYKREAECGTLFCTAGLAATMPEFQEQGYDFCVKYDSVFLVTVNGAEVTSSTVVDPAFGEQAFDQVFSMRGGSSFDEKYMDSVYDDLYEEHRLKMKPRDEVSDKVVAINRLEQQLAIYKEKRNVA